MRCVTGTNTESHSRSDSRDETVDYTDGNLAGTTSNATGNSSLWSSTSTLDWSVGEKSWTVSSGTGKNAQSQYQKSSYDGSGSFDEGDTNCTTEAHRSQEDKTWTSLDLAYNPCQSNWTITSSDGRIDQSTDQRDSWGNSQNYNEDGRSGDFGSSHYISSFWQTTSTLDFAKDIDKWLLLSGTGGTRQSQGDRDWINDSAMSTENGIEDSTSNKSANDHSWQLSTQLTYEDEQWKTTSGTGSTSDSKTTSSISSIVGIVSDGAMSGSTMISNSTNSAWQSSSQLTWDADAGKWKTLSGTAIDTKNQSAEDQLMESGDYSNGSVAGTSQIVVGSSNQSELITTFDLDADTGQWKVVSGSGSSTTETTNENSRSGQGGYTNNAFVGTKSEGFKYSETETTMYALELDAGSGKWEIVSGDSTKETERSVSAGYTGSYDYSANWDEYLGYYSNDGVPGKATEKGAHSNSSHVMIQGLYLDGEWNIESGTATSLIHDEDGYGYEAGGAVPYGGPRGGFDGNVTQKSSYGMTTDFKRTDLMDLNGRWQVEDSSGKRVEKSEQSGRISGGGSYSYGDGTGSQHNSLEYKMTSEWNTDYTLQENGGWKPDVHGTLIFSHSAESGYQASGNSYGVWGPLNYVNYDDGEMASSNSESGSYKSSSNFTLSAVRGEDGSYTYSGQGFGEVINETSSHNNSSGGGGGDESSSWSWSDDPSYVDEHIVENSVSWDYTDDGESSTSASVSTDWVFEPDEWGYGNWRAASTKSSDQGMVSRSSNFTNSYGTTETANSSGGGYEGHSTSMSHSEQSVSYDSYFTYSRDLTFEETIDGQRNYSGSGSGSGSSSGSRSNKEGYQTSGSGYGYYGPYSGFDFYNSEGSDNYEFTGSWDISYGEGSAPSDDNHNDFNGSISQTWSSHSTGYGAYDDSNSYEDSNTNSNENPGFGTGYYGDYTPSGLGGTAGGPNYGNGWPSTYTAGSPYYYYYYGWSSPSTNGASTPGAPSATASFGTGTAPSSSANVGGTISLPAPTLPPVASAPDSSLGEDPPTDVLNDNIGGDPVILEDLTASDPSTSVTAHNGAQQNLFVQPQNGSVAIDITGTVLAGIGENDGKVLWDVRRGSVGGAGAVVASGTSARSSSLTLNTSDGIRSFIVEAGVDSSGDGSLQANEVTRTIVIVVNEKYSLALTVTDHEHPTNKVTASNGAPKDLYIIQDFASSSTEIPIDIQTAYSPTFIGSSLTGSFIVCTIVNQAGELCFQGNFSDSNTISNQILTILEDNQRTFIITTWLDLNLNGVMDAGEDQRTVNVHVVSAKLSTIDYGADGNNFHVIQPDIGGTQYASNQWYDANQNGDTDDQDEISAPICYTRSGTSDGDVFVKASVTLMAHGDLSGLAGKIKIRASGSLGDAGNDMTFAAVDGTYNVDRITATLTSSQALPDTAGFDDLMIYWEVSLDGGQTWVKAGDTRNTLYMTANDPTSSAQLFETVVDIGCWGAKGQSGNTDAIISGIWDIFATNSVYSVDGTLMSYSHANGYAISAAGMLSNALGNGQCTAWADLLVQVLGSQGIDATTVNIFSNFTVKAMPAQGSGGANYTVGTSDPNNSFSFHQVVRITSYPDRIYDPSYGGMVSATAQKTVEIVYEDANIVKYYNGTAWVNQRIGVQDLIFQ